MAKITNLSCHDQWFVFGVDSFSDELCGRYQDSHTAYISTVEHRDWILQVRLRMQSLDWTDILYLLKCFPLPSQSYKSNLSLPLKDSVSARNKLMTYYYHIFIID